MKKTITLIIPHQLSADEARRRIQTGINDFRHHYSHMVQVNDQWTGNHLDANCNALGQTISGRIDVEESRVVLDVDLPWLLARLAGSIQPKLEERATRLLAK